MDIMMPGIDGYEATAAIRSYPKFQSIPISALTNKEEVQKAYEAGADADLTKPVDFDKLMGLLQSHTR
jgi:CheY-like chemotaxis protein